MPSDLAFMAASASDYESTANNLATLSKALSHEGLANYFVRKNTEAAVRLWHELLRLTLAASTSPQQPQLYYLSDCSTAAVMQQWPEDRAGWHRHSALLRLAKIAPWGKWRALREVLSALERQKAAFLATHGPFLYLAAIGTAEEARGRGLGSMLLDHLCRTADQQQRAIYTEASGERCRAWLKRHGFFELLRHAVRPHAPSVYIMVRCPLPPRQLGAGEGSGGAAGSKALQPQPVGSVRAR